MDIRYSPDKEGFNKFTTSELRKSFLIDILFEKNEIPMVYSDVDISITGFIRAYPFGDR